jgi:hypothetical protein
VLQWESNPLLLLGGGDSPEILGQPAFDFCGQRPRRDEIKHQIARPGRGESERIIRRVGKKALDDA